MLAFYPLFVYLLFYRFWYIIMYVFCLCTDLQENRHLAEASISVLKYGTDHGFVHNVYAHNVHMHCNLYNSWSLWDKVPFASHQYEIWEKSKKFYFFQVLKISLNGTHDNQDNYDNKTSCMYIIIEQLYWLPKYL